MIEESQPPKIESTPSIHQFYPSMQQAWLIVGIVILSSVICSPIDFVGANLLGEELAFLAYYTCTMGLALWYVLTWRTRRYGMESFQTKPVSLSVWLLIPVATIALQLSVSLPLSNIIPMPEFIKEMFDELMGRTGLFTFMAIVLAAPILEELIFRGIILHGLLKHYSSTRAIVMSSVMFGVVHLNPWQFISAFVVGCFIGWIYYRSRNILLCIAIHMVNNGFAFLGVLLGDPETFEDQTIVEMYGGWIGLIGLILVGLFVFWISFGLFNKLLPKLNKNGDLMLHQQNKESRDDPPSLNTQY